MELTKAEEQIMHILWKIEKGFVKDIMEYFEEMWNEQNNEPQYQIPSSCLDHANGN